MATPNLQVQNGGFVDFEGNPLANGYLEFQLSHDESYSVGPNQIVAGLKLRVALDVNGNVPTNPATKIYSNDVLLPSGSGYFIRAFKSDGAEAWKSPQLFQFTATPNPLDLGTIVPANPPGAGLGSGGLTLTLQTNGTNNGSQSLLNLSAGSNITLTDNGSGTVTVAASGSSFTTANQAFFFGGQSINPPTGTGSKFSNVNNQVRCARLLLASSFTVRKIALRVQTGSGAADFASCAIYDATGATKLLDAGTNAFSVQNGATNTSVTLGTPVVLNPGTYWFAYAATSSTATSGGSHLVTGSLTQFQAMAALQTFVGTSANSLSGGAMPASLGVITSDVVTLDVCAFTFMT